FHSECTCISSCELRLSASSLLFCFSFTVMVTTDFFTLSLHDALPIFITLILILIGAVTTQTLVEKRRFIIVGCFFVAMFVTPPRSEEHTSELQSRENLVCRLLLEKKK